jgi:hypothetical protein
MRIGKVTLYLIYSTVILTYLYTFIYISLIILFHNFLLNPSFCVDHVNEAHEPLVVHKSHFVNHLRRGKYREN